MNVSFDIEVYSVTHDEFCEYLREEHSPDMDEIVDAIEKDLDYVSREFGVDQHNERMCDISDYVTSYIAMNKTYDGLDDSESVEKRRILAVFNLGALRMFEEWLGNILGRELTEEDCFSLTYVLFCFSDYLYSKRHNVRV